MRLSEAEDPKSINRATDEFCSDRRILATRPTPWAEAISLCRTLTFSNIPIPVGHDIDPAQFAAL